MTGQDALNKLMAGNKRSRVFLIYDGNNNFIGEY
jgi:hypothetical protein